MAFRRKYEILQDFQPDIAVIQECENNSILGKIKNVINYSDILWYGENKNKGLCILTFNKYRIKNNFQNEDFKYILPIEIENGTSSIILLAVWTQFVNKNIYESYVVQAVRALLYYKKLLEEKNVFIIGDFNSNSIWDNESPKEYTHSQMVDLLKQQEIESVYHFLKKEKHGKETIPTLFFQKNIKKSYHIDYCFCKISKMNRIKEFRIGEYAKYITKSDHMPLFIEIE